MQMKVGTSTSLIDDDLWRELRSVTTGAIRTASKNVDRFAIYPAEGLKALWDTGVFQVIAPSRADLPGRMLKDAANLCWLVATECASTALVLAMHFSQVELLHVFGSEWHHALIQEVVQAGGMVASATTEDDGDIGVSRCSIAKAGGGLQLSKLVRTMSYAREAQVVLATARTNPSSTNTQQSLIAIRADQTRINRYQSHDMLGMRGTQTGACTLDASFERCQVFDVEFSDMSACMLAASHLLWGAVWVGVARGSYEITKRIVRRRRDTAGDFRAVSYQQCAWMARELISLEAEIRQGMQLYQSSPDLSSGVFLFDSLKVSLSNRTIALVTLAMQICGASSYSSGGDYALGVKLRDINSAAVMVSNIRICADMASLIFFEHNEGPLFL